MTHTILYTLAVSFFVFFLSWGFVNDTNKQVSKIAQAIATISGIVMNASLFAAGLAMMNIIPA